MLFAIIYSNFGNLKFLGSGGNRYCWGDSSFCFSFLDSLLFKDLSAFVVGWHILRRNLNAKER